jgi:hypothetical protein
MLDNPRWPVGLHVNNPYRDETIGDLHAIYDLFVRRGWIQNASRKPGGPRCLVTALNEVVKDQGRAQRAMMALGFMTENGLVYFNDAPERTKKQVLRRIEEAQRILANG